MVSDNTIPKMFADTVSRSKQQVAMRVKKFGLWQDISWEEYYTRVRYIGSALASMGLERGQSVSIIGDNCWEWVTVDLGIQCVGGVAVGIYATNAAPQVEYVIDHSDSVFFFVENEEQLDKWLQFKERTTKLKKVIVWDLEGLRDYNDPQVMSFQTLLNFGEKVCQAQPGLFDERMQQVTPDDSSVLIYTSGTTGPPKGAVLTHRNMCWMADSILQALPMTEKDEVMSFLPLCHIFEQLFSVIGHAYRGYIVNFIESPDTVTQNMREISPTLGYAVPRIWEKYASSIRIRMSDADWLKKLVFNLSLAVGKKRATLKMGFKRVPLYLEILYGLAYFSVFRKLKERLGFERMRAAVSGAAPISRDVVLFFQSIGINMLEGYGQTEGTGVACVCRPDNVKYGTVGPPLPGLKVKIADDGEILVKSPSVFKEYYKNPEATAETIVDGWLHSGDIGELDEDGFLRITDRKKDIIVTAGGKNITPQYIENKLKASTYINDAIVIGDQRKFLSVLIMIDEDTVVKYAQDNKIQFSTYRDLTQSEQIGELIRGELDAVNKTLSRVEQPKKFRILPKKLYVEDGEVTPTMKVKRSFVHKAFSDLIESMY